jgi:hypothetical protein
MHLINGKEWGESMRDKEREIEWIKSKRQSVTEKGLQRGSYA